MHVLKNALVSTTSRIVLPENNLKNQNRPGVRIMHRCGVFLVALKIRIK